MMVLVHFNELEGNNIDLSTTDLLWPAQFLHLHYNK